MYLGRVVGTLVSTRKEPSLDGLRFLVVRRLTIDNKDTDSYVVAADAVDAGMGEIVLYATGSSARQTKLTHERPNDATIMAIVDTWEVDGDVKYIKQEALEVDLIEGESVSEDGVSEDGVSEDGA